MRIHSPPCRAIRAAFDSCGSERFASGVREPSTEKTVGSSGVGSPPRKERGNEARALHQLGVVQAHTDPPDVVQAETYYHQALALAVELGMRPLQAHCHHGLGTLYATIGQRQQAHAELSAAIDLYRAMEMTLWLPQTGAALAQVEER